MRQEPARRMPVQPVGRIRHPWPTTRNAPMAAPSGRCASAPAVCPTAGGLIALAVRLTEPARQAAGTDALWVGSGSSGLRVFFDTGYELTARLRAWAGHHRLPVLTDPPGTWARRGLPPIPTSSNSP